MSLKISRLSCQPEGSSLAWGRVEMRVGVVWMVFSRDVLCFLGIASNWSEDMWPHIERRLPRAHTILEEDEVSERWATIEQAWLNMEGFPYALSACGSDLEHRVWNTLLRIPIGETVSYAWVAEQTGRPQAVRAVASAIGRNPISLLIPCHRVIAKNGGLGGYAWGISCKRAILEVESALIHA